MVKQVSRWLPSMVLAAPLFAGGFWLQFEDASSNPQAKAQHALFVVKPGGCNHPELAKVTGSAEGIVKGKRTSLPLTLLPLTEAGSYAVSRTWPDEGMWVISLSAQSDGRQTGAIGKVRPEGFRREDTAFLTHVPTRDEVQSSLQSLN